MGKGRARLRGTLRAFRAVIRNPDLRRVELAYFAFRMAELGTWVAILVFAYRQGGAAEAGLVAMIQLAPAAIAAPFASVLGDRVRRERALLLGYVVPTAAMGGVAVALLSGAPVPVIYLLAVIMTTSLTLTRPVQSALLPQLVQTPDELTAANVALGTVNATVVLLGPALAGVLLGLEGPGLVFAVFAGGLLLATLLVARLQPSPPPGRTSEHPWHEAMAGFRALAREPSQRLVVGLLAGQSVIEGAFDVLLVVIALGLLGLPAAGAGYLTAALGAGGVVGGILALRLVGRRHLAPSMVTGLLVYGLASAAIAVGSLPVLVVGLLVIGGAGYVQADTAGRTLLQRVVPDRVLARVFGVLEGLQMGALAVGSILAPVLTSTLGIRGGILAIGLLLPVAILLLWARVRAVDRAAKVPEAEIVLLRSLDLFAPLSPPTLEGVASRLVTVYASPGDVLIRQGDVGDRFYVVKEGELEVTRDGRHVARLRRGGYFGEIALLRDVPRTATVTAATPASLLALERPDFLEAITGHPQSRAAADQVARDRSAKHA
jgi:MFS family permease